MKSMNKQPKEELVRILREKGEELLARPREVISFTGSDEANDFLNDIERYPHAFVLACVMDIRIEAERAWRIPYVISKEAGGREFPKFLRLGQEPIKQVFVDQNLHIWNSKMSERFWLATERIHKEYRDDASLIWKGNPRSGTVVRRFLQFEGVGVKIASMATNILARGFKISMVDRNCIDISPDRHVRRVFYRLGLISDENNDNELLYCARGLNPEYPGVFDSPAWNLGEKICRARGLPKCEECYLNPYCPKKGVPKV